MIHVPEFKKPQHDFVSESYFFPKKLYLPLSQHTGRASMSCVKRADLVEESQVIAKADGYISSILHAPKKGKVSAIDSFNHPVLKTAESIVLECEGQNKEYSKLNDHLDLTRDELLDLISKSGIVGMGGAAFPTVVKLKPPKKINTLIINGCECEPYLATDNRLMLECMNEIIQGVEIVSKIIQPTEVIFAIEANKPEAIKKFDLAVNTKGLNIPRPRVAVLKSLYPQGGEKQLIYSITRQKVPGGKLPLDLGCLVQNVATCFALYEAVVLEKPLIERLVGFYGDCLVKPKNIWLKIGTSIKELFDQGVLEFKKDPKKIISGGPMMGTCLNSLNYPVLKGTGGFLFLSENIISAKEDPCIRCARCIDTCPMDLLPLEYARYVKREKFDKLAQFNITDCIECGCCAFICPAHIPLVQYIKTGKKYLPDN